MSVPIVRTCNRACPECCVRDALSWYNKGLDPRPVPLDELRWAGSVFGPLDRVEFTGGEASLHPEFATLVREMRGWFDAKEYMLVTNGNVVRRADWKELLPQFDRVYVSHYTPAFAARHGGRPNTAEVEALTAFLADHPGTRLWVQGLDAHLPHSGGPPSALRCVQYRSSMVGYFEGRIHGCCVAYGLPERGRTIPLTPDWREHLTAIETPCASCPCAPGMPLAYVAAGTGFR